MSMWMFLGMKSDDCFEEMVRDESTPDSWMQGFELFRDIVAEQTQKGGKPSMRQLAKLAEDDCDLWDWKDDLLDELELFHSWADLLEVIDFFLDHLDWTDPEDASEREDLRWKLANCMGSIEDTELAYELCSNWLEEEPEAPMVQEAMAHICLRGGRLAQAVQLCDQLLEQNPECGWDNIDLYEMALQASLQAGNPERATALQAQITQFQERCHEGVYADLDPEEDDTGFLPF